MNSFPPPVTFHLIILGDEQTCLEPETLQREKASEKGSKRTSSKRKEKWRPEKTCLSKGAFRTQADKKMSYTCPAQRGCGIYCKQKVTARGEYCRHHRHLKPEFEKCKCSLDDGSTCPYPQGPNGFCEYHIEPRQCQGKVLMGGLCLRYIPTGQYCWSCKRKPEAVEDSLKEKASMIRTMLVEKHGPLVPSEKSIHYIPHLSELQIDLKIPPGLKKTELQKPEDCCICQDPLLGKAGETWRQLTCGHFFHLECISKINKMECPLCRAPIMETCLPRWVPLRIRENIANYSREKREEQHQATQAVVRELIQSDLFDMGSSEEDDLATHLDNGAQLGLVATLDARGQNRFALVVLSGSPQ